MMDLLANSTQPEQVDNYPPYNIKGLNEDSYRITMAVAGFTSDDLVIVAQENQLIMTGCRADDDGVNRRPILTPDRRPILTP
jgi:molecular chaperone IbpA